ncbi:MAG: PAS domain S-box protein [Chloroflexota bacterium]
MTAVHEAQEALAESRAQLRSAFEDAALGMLIADSGSRIEDVNPALRAMLGYAPGELDGRTVPELTHPGDIASTREATSRMVSGASDHEIIEKRYLRKNGEPIWMRVNIRCVRDADGRLARFLGRPDRGDILHLGEEALAESREQVRSAFEDAAIGMSVSGSDDRFQEVNSALCAMLGYAREELIGLTFRDLTHPDDLAATLALRGRLRRGEIAQYQMEKRYLRKDGSTLWARVTVRRVVDASGAFLRTIGQVEDISDVHAAQEALAGSEAQLRSAFDDAAIGMVIKIDGRFIDVNPAFCAMLGYERDELIGRGPADITHPDDLDATTAEFERVRSRASERYRLEKRYLRKDGGIVWARVHYRRAYDAEGVYLRSIGQIEDVSDIHEAQEALAGSEARFRAIVQDSSDITAITDPDGTIRWVSPAVTAVLGYDPETWVGQRSFPVIHPSDLAVLRADILEGSGTVGEYRARHADGSWRWMEVAFDGGVNLAAVGGLVFHLRDVTERKEAALAVERALSLEQAALARMAEAADQRADFLAMVAHDFRTPLTAIQCYADLLGLGAAGGDETREFADTIGDSARRLNRMVESLLHLDDLEGDLPPLHPAPADPAEIVEAAARQARSAWPGRQVNLAIAPGLAAVDLDADLVARAIGNLIDNAIKYSPGGEAVDISAAPEAGGFRVTVADQGIGIRKQDLARVFEKFARTDEAEAREIAGTGLGLPIVRAIARAHGGDAWAESPPGGGATVHLIIRNATPPLKTRAGRR